MNEEIIILETNKGNIEILLDREHSPETVENFLSYVDSKFFENTVFHRVISGFMVQGGGFTTEGIQKTTKDPIKLESNNGLSNVIGTVAMARTNDPDSATSQFFINVADNKFLDYTSPSNPGYAVFGKVINGMDIVDQIENIKTTTKGFNQDWPLEDIIILKVYRK